MLYINYKLHRFETSRMFSPEAFMFTDLKYVRSELRSFHYVYLIYNKQIIYINCDYDVKNIDRFKIHMEFKVK